MATTYEEVLTLFKTVAESQRETERLLREQTQETERLLREQTQETERLLREQTQDTDRKFQDTDRKFQDTDRKFQDTDRKIKAVTTAIGDLGNRLGEFVEGLVRPAVVRLFRERGIAVHEVYPDVEVDRAGEGLEIDLLVVNDAEAVLVEVKSKLTQADVDEHVERLGKFKRLMPRYAAVQAFGAVAAMVVPREVGRYAYRQDLFVLAQAGDSVVILNDTRFRPKAW